MTTRCDVTLSPLTMSIKSPKKGKREYSRSLQVKYLMEDDPNYVGELELDLLTHRKHSLTSSQIISTHLSFLWPMKSSHMDYAKEIPREHPYSVGLNSSIRGKEREFVSKRFLS